MNCPFLEEILWVPCGDWYEETPDGVLLTNHVSVRQKSPDPGPVFPGQRFHREIIRCFYTVL